MIAYGHASACCILRRRRASELLPGRRAARRDAAGRLPADPFARETARPAAARPLRPPRRAGPPAPAPAPPGRPGRAARRGWRLSRSALRLLAQEEQLLAELGAEVQGELSGRL